MHTSSFGPAFLQRETGKSGQDIKERKEGWKDKRKEREGGRKKEKNKKYTKALRINKGMKNHHFGICVQT